MSYIRQKLSRTEHLSDALDEDRALEGKYLVDRESEGQAPGTVTARQAAYDEPWFMEDLDPGGVEELRFE